MRATVELGEIAEPDAHNRDEMLAVDAALDRLATADSTAAELVKLRYFAGFSIPQSAEILGISPRTADRLWSYARAWLRKDIERVEAGRGGVRPVAEVARGNCK